MGEMEVIEVGREAILVMISMAAPVMLIGLVVGLIIALFQALTQIQEMTLSFVPKILVVFSSLLFLMPYLVTTLTDFFDTLADRIIALG